MHRIENFTRLALALVFVALSAQCLPVLAQAPDKVVRLIVPWAPGGSTDAIARALAARMSETMGKSVVVENRPGAAGQIGTDAAAKAAPDGNTMTIIELPHAIAPAVTAKLPYDLLRDFSPVTMIGTSPLILFTSSESGASSTLPANLKAYLNVASKSAVAPSIAHSGPGTISHLAGEMFARQAKVKFNMVPYRGSGPALTDVAGGVVSAHFATMASGAGLLTTQKIRALAVTSAKRMTHPALREVPTFDEQGIKGFEINQWWALVVPATTPIEIVEKIRLEATSALAHPMVRERLSSLAVDLKGSTRDELRGFIRAEAQRWQEVARLINLQAQ
jgi:tripartite-type tricarboxylate transporter receptor subunit TctC